MSNIRALLVEGPNDYHVLKALLQHYSFKVAELKKKKYPDDGDFVIKPKGGVEDLLKGLPQEIKVNEEPQLGVIIDADINVENPQLSIEDRWKAITYRLKESGYDDKSVPSLPDPNGTIIKGNDDLPNIGIWIMPTNELPGKIEDFIQLLVPLGSVNELLWKRAEASVQAIPKTERLFTDNDTQKAYVHTYLAWQEEPGRPIGESITRRYLNADAPIAETFIAWIRKLFEIPIS